jgi:hypothetical protein
VSWETTATYGAISPLWFGRGDEHIAQRAENVAQHDRDHTGNYTQVRATARRKTLLLLWWIDGGLWWKRSALARQGCLEARAATRVRVYKGPNPFYLCHGPPFIDQGVATVAIGHCVLIR